MFSNGLGWIPIGSRAARFVVLHNPLCPLIAQPSICSRERYCLGLVPGPVRLLSKLVHHSEELLVWLADK